MRNSTSYALAGPRTFRRGSRKILHKWGSNLQNIAKEMREMYIPDGYKPELFHKCKYYLETGDITIFTEQELLTLRIFIQRDQSGAEALIVAYECRNGDYRKLFTNNVKPHVYVALKLFRDIWPIKAKEHNLPITEDIINTLYDTPIENLRSNPYWSDLDKLIKASDGWSLTERYYYLAKQTVHSANYGIRWAMFILNVLEKSGGKIVLVRDQGEYFLNTYRALFPELNERNDNIIKQAEKHKILYNIFGHPYQITAWEITDTMKKELYAWTAQSSVAEITRIAFSRGQEWIESERLPIDILADTHDSYLWQSPLEYIKSVVDKSGEFMNQRLVSPNDGTIFNMKSECKIGFNWSDYKEGKNELGLREVKWL